MTDKHSKETVTSQIVSKGVPTPNFNKAPPKEDAQMPTNQRPETMQQLQDRLRDACLAYNETVTRCQLQFKSKAANEQFNRLYYQPNVPFLQEPEKQKAFRKDFLNDISALPEPKPIQTIADQIHADVNLTIADRSGPQQTKEEMIEFFTRRQAQLQHKKHKMIKRWALAFEDSGDLDRISPVFDNELKYLQIEQDSVTTRLMRLTPEDNYCHDGSNQRYNLTSDTAVDGQTRTESQKHANKLYKEAEQQTNDSALREDDFEVFLRHSTYVNRVNRPAKKLIQTFKWLSHEKRYEIWREARIMMNNYQRSYNEKKRELNEKICGEVDRKLKELGIKDEKAICAERYIYHLKDYFESRAQQMLNSQKFNHFEPFMLYPGKFELKQHLMQLAKEYGLNTTQLDIDNGQMFTYQLQTFFPSRFEKQVKEMTFDWEDTGPNADTQMIDRLTRSLGLNKDQMLSEMAQYAKDQRTASLLNALNVGKTGQTDMTLKDLTENELNKDQYTRHNLLRKLRRIEFFSLDESGVRIRKADWLHYVCWTPQVSTYVQRQNQHLSSTSNRIDHLLKSAMEFSDVNDSVIVNKIIEDSIKVHIQKINETQARIAKCMGPHKNVKGTEQNTEGAVRSLTEATNPKVARSDIQKPDPNLNEAQQIQFNKFQDLPNVDQLTHNLTKAFYTLRVIKTRDIKIKLLQVVNYFRAVQRILALDVREYMTREKSFGDHNDIIDPHFGQREDKTPILKSVQPSGPSEIFNSTVDREYDQRAIKGKEAQEDTDPVTFKAYKLRNSFDPIKLSTCPIVPKHHRTFGRPSIYESVSKEREREQDLNQDDKINFKRMQALLTMRDRIVINEETKEILVKNEYGQTIVYNEALSDMHQLEEELIKIGSYYINRYEYIIKNNEVMGPDFDEVRPTSLIDRPQIALDLLEKEYNFQYAKIKLCEQYMQVYEHVTDPLESMRVLQVIADLIIQRPRLNMEASMYCESYQAETEVLNEKSELMCQFIDMQKSNEYKENYNVHDYLERRLRKLQEHVNQYWVMEKAKDKSRRIGSNETNQNQNELAGDGNEKNVDELLRQKIQQTEKIEAEKQKELEKIKQRHITEFANEQHNDFASVLGLPQVTMEQLYQRFDESEPIVLDSLREQAFFQKMVEGYPSKLLPIDSQTKNAIGLHFEDCNLTDFYESMMPVTKLNAALAQSFQDLESETMPENGFAAACLEVNMIKKARFFLGQRSQIINEGGIDPDYLKGQELFEEDFYLGCPDKLIFQMKDFHMQGHETNLYKTSNPLIISKLDTQSVTNFNFPRIKPKEVYDALNKDGIPEIYQSEHLYSKTIKMAKNSVSRPNLSFIGEPTLLMDSEKEKNEQKQLAEHKVFVPSMLRMFCNITEVIRMREEIIMRMNESTILARIYEQQCQLANKSTKSSIGEQISFNTNQVMSEHMNYIDLNDGSGLNFSNNFPFMEFDQTLQANLDFKSESCIKALFTDLGVEELRAILHLQIAHQKLLQVAVRNNQLLVDKPLKGRTELELIEKREITTPNSVIDLNKLLGGNSDCSNITAEIKHQKIKMNEAMSKGINEAFIMIVPRKNRDRGTITKRFSQVCQKLTSADLAYKPELILRVLRSYRLQLCFGYCQSMVQEAIKDSVKVQIMETCNTLRMRATLLPYKSQVFRLGKSDTQENLSFDAHEQLKKYKEFTSADAAEMSIDSILKGSGVCSASQTLFYIPSSEEISDTDRKMETQKVLKDHTQDHVAPESIDQNVKVLFKRIQFLNQPQYKIEGKQQYGVRKVWLEDTPDLSKYETYHLLIYVANILHIFDLEYTMLRNQSRAWETQALEDKTQSGRPFWSEIEEKKKKIELRQMRIHTEEDSQGNLIENKTAMKVIQYLDLRKKAWIDLEEDIEAISRKLKKLDQNCKELPAEKKNLKYLNDLLTLQHQSAYYAFMNGVENMIDYYLERDNEEYFLKLSQVRDQLANKNTNQIQLIRSNGYYIQQYNITPQSINVDASPNEEYFYFKNSYQTVIDEKCLIPRQVTLVRQLFGNCSFNQRPVTKFGYTDLLKSAFYNMEQDARSQLSTNQREIDKEVDYYLQFKGLKEVPGQRLFKQKDHFSETLLAQVEYLSFKIDASHLQRILIAWEAPNNVLPQTTKGYRQALRKFKDAHTMGILAERDSLNDQYWMRQKNKPDPRAGTSKSEKEREMMQSFLNTRQNQQVYYSKINVVRAESIVIKNILEVNLIKIAIEMVKNEHSALQKCFEVSGQDKAFKYFVHASQQFASTPYSKVDRNQNLDVSVKVGFLQTFLTRLRNRCTEVETLTSGPGLVFSTKDFNDCLTQFARQLIKFGEEELRNRCELANLQKYQYHHIIYIKQMENLYYRKKCEQLLQNIETLTNAKMLSQGNQMIYELDVGARELQTLKDHYYVMEKCIRSEIRQEFNNEIIEKDALIKKQKDDFESFKKEIALGLSAQVAEEINTVEQKFKQKNNQRQMNQVLGQKTQPVEGLAVKESSDPELLNKILHMTKAFRKQKMFHSFQSVITNEKHDKEVATQKQKQSENQSLWESLAEAEKREQITQQELKITKNNLIHYEKLIQKLYSQLEHLQFQKEKLEQQKHNGSKQIKELECKMQDLEILESLDLNKILEEMRQRDKKIFVLDKVDQNFNTRIEQMQAVHAQQMEEMKKALNKERSAKLDAFEKLDAMRIEMKSLEGKDSVKNDLWKDKCKELYDICRELEIENDNLKSNVKDLQLTVQNQKNYDMQSNTLQNSTSDQSGFQPVTREQLILQRRKYANKPHTATSEHGGRRLYGKAMQARNQGNKLVESAANLDSLKISAEGYDRRQLNTLRTQTNQNFNKLGQNKQSQSSAQDHNTATTAMNKTSFGPNNFLTVNNSQKSATIFGQNMANIASMPQIKGAKPNLPIAVPGQSDEGQLMIDSGTLRVKK